MSIGVFCKTYKNGSITEEFLRKHLPSDKYELLNLIKNEDGVLESFSVNPLNPAESIYEQGYEFHLQQDGRYWHPVLTRDDDEFAIDESVVSSIAIDLYIELEYEE